MMCETFDELLAASLTWTWSDEYREHEMTIKYREHKAKKKKKKKKKKSTLTALVMTRPGSFFFFFFFLKDREGPS